MCQYYKISLIPRWDSHVFGFMLMTLRCALKEAIYFRFFNDFKVYLAFWPINTGAIVEWWQEINICNSSTFHTIIVIPVDSEAEKSSLALFYQCKELAYCQNLLELHGLHKHVTTIKCCISLQNCFSHLQNLLELH